MCLRWLLALSCASLASCEECGKKGVLCVETSTYMVIVDAGSTGSRAHAYRYDRRSVSSKSYPLIEQLPLTHPEELLRYDTRPGISGFLNDSFGVHKSLGSLLRRTADGLLLQAPYIHLKHVPVYLGATAGLRSLSPWVRDSLIANVTDFFRSADNPFYYESAQQVRVLAGEEEGAFGWLALNRVRGEISAHSDHTVGAIDVGGASAQISFIPKEPSILGGVFPMHFGQAFGGPIHLYSHSYLGYGFGLSFGHASRILYKASTGDALQHPCLSTGVTWSVSEENNFILGLNGTRSGDIHMHGSGNFEACSALARQLLMEGPCLQPPCSFAGVYQPALRDMHFVIFGEVDDFFAWGVEGWIQSGMPLLMALKQQMQRICELPFSTQVELFGDGGRTQSVCWRGVWLLNFLHHGLRFSLDTRSLEIVKGCCDVAAGRAIYEVNYYPYTVRPRWENMSAVLSPRGERSSIASAPRDERSATRVHSGQLPARQFSAVDALQFSAAVAGLVLLVVGLYGLVACRFAHEPREGSRKYLLG